MNATIAAARSQWFRVVSAVLSNLELSDAPIEAIETIRGPVVNERPRRASLAHLRRLGRIEPRTGGRIAEFLVDPHATPTQSCSRYSDKPVYQ